MRLTALCFPTAASDMNSCALAGVAVSVALGVAASKNVQ